MNGPGVYARRVRTGDGGLWTKGKPALARLDIELTERCNFNCLHCSIGLPAGDAEARGKELDAPAIKGLLKEAAALGCLLVRFTGGEPLLREDFPEIYLAARRLGLRVMLFTNASPLTPPIVELMKKYPPLETIEVTVYGMSPEDCRSVTGNERAFEASRRGIELLIEKQLPFIVKGALLPQSAGGLAGFESWASRLPWMRGEKPSLAMAFELRTRRDSEARNEGIRKVRPEPESIVRLEGERDPGWEDLLSFVAGRHSLHGAELFTCSKTGSATIDAYGRLQYCISLRHPDTVYDLGRGSLEEGVKEFLPRVARTKAKDPDYLARCGRCFLKDACLQCPAGSWSEHGTLDTPVEYHCRITHLKAERAGLIRSGEKAWLSGSRIAFPAGSQKRPGRESACSENLKESDNG